MISLRSMILSVTGCELFEKIPPGGIISLQAENTIQSEVVKMIIKIENDALLAELSTQGAYIEKLYDKKTGKDHIWQYDAQYWPRRTSICFPIMSILKNDETVIEGKTYHMENHGFLREMALDVISSGADCVTMRAQANEMTKKHYPYDFCFDVTYRLEGDALAVEYNVSNQGTIPMDYCLGVHTTYKVSIDDAENMQEDLYLQFEAPETAGIHVVEGGLQTHNYRPYLENSDTIPLKGAFEDGALIFDTDALKSRSVSICSRKSSFRTRVDFSGWKQIAFWAKPGNMPFLCIEPMTGLADYVDTDGNFHSKPDIITLQPGDAKLHRYVIRTE